MDKQVFRGWRLVYLIFLAVVIITTCIAGNYLAATWQALFAMAWLFWQDTHIKYIKEIRENIDFLKELQERSKHQ